MDDEPTGVGGPHNKHLLLSFTDAYDDDDGDGSPKEHPRLPSAPPGLGLTSPGWVSIWVSSWEHLPLRTFIYTWLRNFRFP